MVVDRIRRLRPAARYARSAASRVDELVERARDEAAREDDERLELEVDAHARLAAGAQVAAHAEAGQAERGRVADLGRRAGVDLLAVELGDQQLRAADRRALRSPTSIPNACSRPSARAAANSSGSDSVHGSTGSTCSASAGT